MTMTPKNKAQELFDKFALGGWGKEHANSCINEIIESIKYLEKDISYINLLEYWEEVKEEIEKL